MRGGGNIHDCKSIGVVTDYGLGDRVASRNHQVLCDIRSAVRFHADGARASPRNELFIVGAETWYINRIRDSS